MKGIIVGFAVLILTACGGGSGSSNKGNPYIGQWASDCIEGRRQTIDFTKTAYSMTGTIGDDCAEHEYTHSGTYTVEGTVTTESGLTADILEFTMVDQVPDSPGFPGELTFFDIYYLDDSVLYYGINTDSMTGALADFMADNHKLNFDIPMRKNGN